MHELIIGTNEAGRRFDRFLQSYLNRANKSLLHKLLRKKRIKLNGARAYGNEITAEGDRVAFYISPETLNSLKETLSVSFKNWGDIDIVYEDEHILLVSKPAGLLTHSNQKESQDTLVDRIAYYLQSNNFAVTNRLDRNTSGLVACGKNLPAIQALNTIFASRKVEKIYFATVCGKLTGSGHLRGYLYKDEAANRSYIFDTQKEDTVPVHTEYEVIHTGNDFSQVRVRLHTGKSHQIRAHFASIGHPLVGDVKYGGKKIAPVTNRNRLQLHCHTFKFLDIDIAPLGYLTGMEWSAKNEL